MIWANHQLGQFHSHSTGAHHRRTGRHVTNGPLHYNSMEVSLSLMRLFDIDPPPRLMVDPHFVHDHLVLQSFSTLFSRCPTHTVLSAIAKVGLGMKSVRRHKLGGTHVLKQEYVDALWKGFPGHRVSSLRSRSRIGYRWKQQTFWVKTTVVHTQLCCRETTGCECLSSLGLLLLLSLVCIFSHIFCVI